MKKKILSALLGVSLSLTSVFAINNCPYGAQRRVITNTVGTLVSSSPVAVLAIAISTGAVADFVRCASTNIANISTLSDNMLYGKGGLESVFIAPKLISSGSIVGQTSGPSALPPQLFPIDSQDGLSCHINTAGTVGWVYFCSNR